MRNNPDYYNIGGEDTIKTIIGIVDNNGLGTEQSIYLFNTLKYLVRFNNKNKFDDLIKAKDYLERLMEVYGKDEDTEDDMPEELVSIKNALEKLGKSLRDNFEGIKEDLDLSTESDFESLKKLVLDWADDKDLLADNMEDEMGDIFVTLIILCEQLNMNPVYCLGRACEKIKDRKGKTINGVFVKEEDL